MKRVLKVFDCIGNVLNIISIGALLVMIGLTIADVFLRLFFKAPITGTVEIVRMMMITMSPVFVSALLLGRHVDVGIFVEKFSVKVQFAFAIFGHVISAFLCTMMAYQAFVEVLRKMAQHQVYTMLKIPTWPFYAIFGVAMWFFAAAIVVKLIEKIVTHNIADEEVTA